MEVQEEEMNTLSNSKLCVFQKKKVYEYINNHP
jgi:hypothetical protein